MFRIVNALRCYAAYLFSLCGRIRVRHMPMFVSVEPANICQLRCPECPVGQRANSANAQHFMSMPVWQRVVEQVAPYAYTMQFYFQGEPLLHNDLPQMIAQAHGKGLYTIVSTNAQAMTSDLADKLAAAGLNRIIVSMDGLTPETYNSYRVGGNIDKCRQTLLWLRQAKQRYNKRMIIELQCLRLRTNEHEWQTFKQQYRVMGADRLVLKTAQLYDYADGHPLMPSDNRYCRYEKAGDGRYHRKRLRKACFRVWSGCVITTDGTVLPCCYDKSAQYAYGNIMNTDLRMLFTSEKARTFRQAAWREQPFICKECWK